VTSFVFGFYKLYALAVNQHQEKYDFSSGKSLPIGVIRRRSPNQRNHRHKQSHIYDHAAIRDLNLVRCTPIRQAVGWRAERNALGYAKHRSRSHDAVIRVYDEAGNVIEAHEHAGDFKEW
jgi:hypothetical protein